MAILRIAGADEVVVIKVLFGTGKVIRSSGTDEVAKLLLGTGEWFEATSRTDAISGVDAIA